MNIKKLILICFSVALYTQAHADSTKSIEKVKNAIVRIEVFPRLILTSCPQGKWMGTGFIVDKQRGLIVTNKHVSGGPGLFEYEITLNSGKKLSAVQLFYDNNCDVAVLQVNPKEIQQASELKFSTEEIKVGQKNIIVSNNEEKDFSYQEGTIVDTSDICSPRSFQLIISSLNTRGGSSGSPLLNQKYEIIGLHFGDNDTYSSAIHLQYIKKIVEDIQANKVPERNNLGVQFKLCNIYDAVKFLNFPVKDADKYVQKFKNSRGLVLLVSQVMHGFPDIALQEGDIVLEVNGKPLNCEVKDIDFANLHSSSAKTAKLKIFRNGSYKNIDTPLISINQNHVKKVVSFCGANFFSPDLSMCYRASVLQGRVLFVIELNSSSFGCVMKENDSLISAFNCFEIIAINGEEILSLDQLEKKLEELKHSQNFYITYRTIVPRTIGSYNDLEFLSMDFSRREQHINIKILEISPKIQYYTINKDKKWDLSKQSS